ncbi:MAG: hypothetical protein P4L33_22290 [Capsulimonadaceae bacterium]|nr:hypothetical protein [Capsulimonadaceae bacterium]
MNKKFIAAVAIALTPMLWSSVAQADQDTTKPAAPATTTPYQPIIKLGVYLPSNDDLKTLMGDTWLSIGAEFPLKGQIVPSTLSSIYLDVAYANKSASDDLGDSASLDVTSVGVGYGVKYLFSQGNSQSVVPYLGAGVGVYGNQAKLFVSTADGDSGTSTVNNTNVGYKISAGIMFNKRGLVELGYTDPGKLSGDSVAGTSILVGWSF